MAIILAVLCVSAGLVVGQTAENGAISGVIEETNGTPIPGVRVSLLNVDSALPARASSSTTDAKGAYTFSNVLPGTYTVTAELAGFQTARYSRIALASKQTLSLNFKMQLGAVSSPVELSLNPPKEETRTAMALPPLPPLPTVAELGLGDVDARSRCAQTCCNCFSIDPNRLGRSAEGSAKGGQAPGALSQGDSPAFFYNGEGSGAGRALSPAPRPGVATIVPSTTLERPDRITVLPAPNRPTTETYERIADNPFIAVSQEPLSTLAVDVDTASYSNVRRFLAQAQLPPRDAVRIEELINYFSYDYPFGSSEHPITANIEAAAAPWNPSHSLVRVGIKAKDMLVGSKRSNLVFLIDVSGSMSSNERLPLLRSGMNMLVEKLTENDTVSIVTYAGESGVALKPTNGTHKEAIRQVIDGLRAEGSTNGGAGIQTAYDLAMANFIKGGVNRVILMTDGDFNVGVTSQNELISMIEEKARGGVFLSVLGVGTGNLRDNTMEKLADKGHGNYAYLDSLSEARKALVDQMASTFITVAKDVKIQVEFNPRLVLGYRLIGYENRLLAAAEFNDDKKDGGDMGSGHTVTALFEVVPRGAEINPIGGDPLRFQPVVERVTPEPDKTTAMSTELLNLKIRYKEPEGTDSKLIEFPLIDRGQAFSNASSEFRFAAAVAAFGMILRDSPFKGSANWDLINSIAMNSRGADRDGYREEFVRLADRPGSSGSRRPQFLGAYGRGERKKGQKVHAKTQRRGGCSLASLRLGVFA
jgi:Ca-activated chloride channel family protein